MSMHLPWTKGKHLPRQRDKAACDGREAEAEDRAADLERRAAEVEGKVRGDYWTEAVQRIVHKGE